MRDQEGSAIVLETDGVGKIGDVEHGGGHSKWEATGSQMKTGCKPCCTHFECQTSGDADVNQTP